MNRQMLGYALIGMSAGILLGALGLSPGLILLIMLPIAAALEGIRRWRNRPRKPRRVGPSTEWIE